MQSEIFGLLGLNDAGKTTTIKIIVNVVIEEIAIKNRINAEINYGDKQL
ncbi:hypothetical protein J7L27_04855 [Candidatus Bathyarchaeota archaeon]|nr:hypothetical protein [Candidatus Bathyarchaeota archaeon]